MAERDSGWISGGVVDAEDARLATGLLAAPASGPLASRTGIRPTAGHPGRVEATATASKDVTVRPFQAVIQGTRGSSAGAYLVTSDATKTVDVLGASPADASQPRHDLLVARQFDPQYADSRTGMVVERVTGTPAVSPVDPAVPGDHLLLARIRVRAGATTVAAGDITNLRRYTSALGGITLARDAADRPVDAYMGFYIHRLDTNRLEVFDGAQWRYPLADDTGWQSVTPATDWVAGGGTVEESTFRVRRIGSMAHFRAGATRQRAAATGPSLVCTVPVGFRPAWIHWWVTATRFGIQRSLPQFFEMSVRTDGTVVVAPDSANAPVAVDETLYITASWPID
jgi:hypothetical protein